jgi:hypothetical protein
MTMPSGFSACHAQTITLENLAKIVPIETKAFLDSLACWPIAGDAFEQFCEIRAIDLNKPKTVYWISKETGDLQSGTVTAIRSGEIQVDSTVWKKLTELHHTKKEAYEARDYSNFKPDGERY